MSSFNWGIDNKQWKYLSDGIPGDFKDFPTKAAMNPVQFVEVQSSD